MRGSVAAAAWPAVTSNPANAANTSPNGILCASSLQAHSDNDTVLQAFYTHLKSCDKEEADTWAKACEREGQASDS
ncbi:hypothetical protein MCOR05_006678 [Pyricularia oryzae]|nr:hypothetical protein MCOR05_006678 [Pyricularia oryzae]